MSAATEIEARIVEVSSYMKVHMDLSRQLNRKEIQFRRQLNVLNDPVARLPLEVSSEIFVQCLHAWPDPRAHCTPIRLMNVCHDWSKIALFTPALWATIRLIFPEANSHKEALSTRLERARNRPLHISIELAGLADPNVLSLVWCQSVRLKSLSVLLGVTHYAGFFDGMELTAPLKCLTTLILRGAQGTRSFCWSYLVRLLRCSPNITHLALDNIVPMNVWVADPAKPLVFPHLRRIVFAQESERIRGKADFLKSVSAPQLETLYLSLSRKGFNQDDFHSFLGRSLPPLQELVLDCSTITRNALTEDALGLVSTLAKLKLISPSPPVMNHFFNILARPYSLLLPHLVQLRIRSVNTPPPDSTWKAILLGLQARRTQIKQASITMAKAGGKKAGMPPRNIFGSLMDLSADGLYFFVGVGQEEARSIV